MFNTTEILAQIDSLLKGAMKPLVKAIQTILKTEEIPPLKSLGFEILPDNFNMVMYLSCKDEETTINPIDIFATLTKNPLEEVLTVLSAIPEPNTEAGYAELDKLYAITFKSVATTIAEAFEVGQIKSICSKAFVWFTDDNQALNIGTKRWVGIEKVENLLNAGTSLEQFYVTTPPKGTFPAFFADPDVDWNNERVEQELLALKQVCAKIFEAAQKNITETIKGFINKHKPPANTLFVDLQILDTGAIRPFVQFIKEKDIKLSNSHELFLGKHHPLADWTEIIVAIAEILNTSDFGVSLFKKIIAAHLLDMCSLFNLCWQEAVNKRQYPPVFFRTTIEEFWFALDAMDKQLSFEQVKQLAKTKP